MFVPKKIIDIEIARPLDSLADLEGYSQAHALVRLRGVPLGYVKLGTGSGRPAAGSAMETILKHHSHGIIRALAEERLKAGPLRKKLRTEDLFLPPPPDDDPGQAPMVTVAVCTRDRAADLDPCLESLLGLDYPSLDIVVVDNAPATDATERLVRDRYPAVRYSLEPRPGLDWARNRAVLEARGEIVAFADDDVVADPGWVRALAAIFVENPDVMAVTGLVAPLELETEAQEIFENYNGFGKGFEYQWARVRPGRPGEAARLHGGTGKFGTGANMAYRRRVFDEIGLFDPALDVGTVTNGGGDLEMFFRVIKEGHTLVYEPRAVVRHRHRREYRELRRQIHTWGIGYYSFLTRSFLAYPDERLRIALGPCMWWVAHLKRLARNLLKPTATKDLVLREMHGSLLGPYRYLKARARAEEISRTFGPQAGGNGDPRGERPRRSARKRDDVRIAVRTVDVSRPIAPLEGLRGYDQVRVYVSLDGNPVGRVDLSDFDDSICASRLRHAIVKHLTFDLFDSDGWPDIKFLSAHVYSEVARRFMALADPHTPDARAPKGLPADAPVSIVVATMDRPDDLRCCLKSLTAQKTARPLEIIVVDNNPASGLTPPVVACFPGVRLESESRKGVSYARNKGFMASTSGIVAVTDDDAEAPDNWVENLVEPFTREDVMAVTGNVLPMELETGAQQHFEAYGGLSRGFRRFEVDRAWFDSFRREAVPTWHLGGTACVAFRSEVFRHPGIGLLEESLGPGTATGVGEDTYVFYKILKEGFTIVYEPKAFVWHKHRRDARSFRRQIYNYSKGHVAYHLFTFLRDGDLRGLWRVFFELPGTNVKQGWRHLRNRISLPPYVTLFQVLGNLAGPFALWRSLRRVKRQGRSGPYIPPAERAEARAVRGEERAPVF